MGANSNPNGKDKVVIFPVLSGIFCFYMKFINNIEWEKVFVVLGIPLFIGFAVGNEYGVFFGIISWFISLLFISSIYGGGSF